MGATQTGPARPVKRRDGASRGGRRGTSGALLAALLALAGCADAGWHQQGKAGTEMRRDLRACERDAEEATLAQSGASRSDFGAAAPGAGLPSRGETPLQFHDRSAMAERYNRRVESCMTAKGYAQGHPADQAAKPNR